MIHFRGLCDLCHKLPAVSRRLPLPSPLSKAPAAQLPRSLLAQKSVTARLVQQVALQPHPGLAVAVRVPNREDLGVLLEPAPRPSGHAARHHFVLERGALHREVLHKHCAQPSSLSQSITTWRQRNRSGRRRTGDDLVAAKLPQHPNQHVHSLALHRLGRLRSRLLLPLSKKSLD